MRPTITRARTRIYTHVSVLYIPVWRAILHTRTLLYVGRADLHSSARAIGKLSAVARHITQRYVLLRSAAHVYVPATYTSACLLYLHLCP